MEGKQCYNRCACFALHRLSILGVVLDKHTRMSLSTSSLDLYFVFIFVSAENAGLHKYVVANGNKMFTALLDNSGYSVDTLSQKAAHKDFSRNWIFRVWSHESSASSVITPARAALLTRDINRKPVVPNHGNTSTQCTETEWLTYVCKFESIWVVNC